MSDEANDGEDLESAVRRADAAVFEAKHTGRDRVVVHGLDGAATSDDAANAGTNGRSRRRRRTAPLRVS